VLVTAPVTVDVAGAYMGGAARYAAELYDYLRRTRRDDVRVIGSGRRVNPAWLVRREVAVAGAARRIALNNVSFVAPGGERWVLLRNALHFLTDSELSRLDPSLRASMRRQSTVIRLSARRADVLVVPSTAMADRVTRVLPGIRCRIIVRPHPVSADSIPAMPCEPSILCPVLFAPYKEMTERLSELAAALDEHGDSSIRLRITADRDEVPTSLARNPHIEFAGRVDNAALRTLWTRSSVIYFPSALESFGYPLAEARVSGKPVIARDTPQNREIAGPALFGFSVGDAGSLRDAIKLAFATDVKPDPGPFDPDAYFEWLLGHSR
jgi:glycosyltransferase involved in cell wall biosynthesis